jgi:gamma-glutamyl phosphate reductase
VLAADEEKVPLNKESAQALELLVVKQQLASTQLQLLQERLYQQYLKQEGAVDLVKQISDFQAETNALVQDVYKDADLSMEEYSLNLEAMMFERIATEEPTEIAEVGGQE